MKFILSGLLMLTTLGSGLLLVSGCSQKSDDATSTSSTTYAGPGSDYRIEIAGSTARIRELDSGLDITGTVSTLSTGFSRMTVTTVTNDGGIGVVTGDTADMLIIPGLVTLLKPLSGSQIIAAVPTGSCPTTDVSLTWIATKMTDPSTEDLYGRFTYTASTDTANVKGFLASNATATPDVDNNITSLNCSSGVATPTGATMYLTASGGAIVKLDQGAGTADDRFVAALPSETVASGDLDGTYSGVIFDEQSGSTTAAKAVVSGTSVTVTSIDPSTDAASGAVSDTLTISSFNYNSIGIIAGTLSGTQEMRCMANQNINSSGKNFLFCVGQSPTAGADATDVFTAVFVSR